MNLLNGKNSKAAAGKGSFAAIRRALKRLQAETAAELDALLPALLPRSLGFGGTGDRAWTHSLPARSGCALLLRKILLTRSQLTRIKGEW